MKVVAHRGYSARFPENSLLAFEQAIAAGADLVETDVRMSSDGVLVCWHDPDFQRVAGVDVLIAQTPAAELTKIALPHGARVCRLIEVLPLVRHRVPLMIDVKVDDWAVWVGIIEALGAARMTSQVVCGVRSAESARVLSTAGVGFARLAMPSKPDMLDAFPSAHLVGARLWEDQIDEAAVARVRSRGIELWVTAGVRPQGEAPGHITAERLEALCRLGGDAVLVNDVAMAGAIAHRHAKEQRR